MPGRYASSSQDDKRAAKAGDIGLPLAADVEQAGMEGHRDGKAGEDEIGRVVERVADRDRVSTAPQAMMRIASNGLTPITSTTRPATINACTRLMIGSSPISIQRGSGDLRRRAHAASSAWTCALAIIRPRVRSSACVAVHLADDPALEHHQDAVAQRHDLVQLDRDQQDGAAGIAQGEQLAMDEFDGADIDAAGRLADQQHLGLARDLARQDQLLLVAAGEVAAPEVRIARPDVEALHQLAAGVGHGVAVHQDAAVIVVVVVIAEDAGFPGRKRVTTPRRRRSSGTCARPCSRASAGPHGASDGDLRGRTD